MPSSSTGHAALNIDTLVKNIDQAILKQRKISANEYDITIYKVDHRAVGEDEYTPHYVPIGPYHRDSLPSQQRADVEKLRIIMGVQTKVANLRGLLAEVNEMEAGVRACYDVDDRVGKMVGDEFVQMLLFDGCYLLVCFVERDLADAALAPGTMESRVRDSFFLLENQIPFFVLERIYVRVYGKDKSNVLRILRDFVQNLLRERLYTNLPQGNIATTDPVHPDHLLHLVHQYFTLANSQPTQANHGTNTQPTQANHGTNTRSTNTNDGTGRWRRATEYCSRANVRFECPVFSNNSRWSVLDVKLDSGKLGEFVSGKLRMPRLYVDNNTWTILRNLMALEQLPRHSENPRVTAYCLFMSELACTAEDVELLCNAGVVEHLLESDAEAAKGFAKLCDGVALELDDPSRNYLQPMWHKLESRCRSPMHNFFGWFRQRHCRNFYYIAAFVVAVIFFACAVLQTVFTVHK